MTTSQLLPVAPEKFAFAPRLLESGAYSDLTISCGMERFKLHKAVVCPQSKFFEGACRSGLSSFKEADTGIIDLSHDEPEDIQHMIDYFYKQDYLQSTRATSGRSKKFSPVAQKAAPTPCEPPRIDSPQMEIKDPLLASVIDYGMYKPRPVEVEPATEPEEPVEETSESVPDEEDDGNFEDDTPALLVHTRVYAIADKYDIPGLKSLARAKFAEQVTLNHDSPEFALACREVYDSTLESDRGLRDVIIQAFRSHPKLALREEVESVAREVPDLGFELFRMAMGLPVYVPKAHV